MGFFSSSKKKVNEDAAEARIIFIIGAPDSDYELVGRTTKLLGLPEFEKTNDIERLNYDILRTLKLDLSAIHLMPENWEKNDLLDVIRQEIRDFAIKEIANKEIAFVTSCNLARTGNLWAEEFRKCGIETTFLTCFTKPNDNYLPWLIYNLEAEKSSRGFTRGFIHLPDFLSNWRKAMRKTQNLIDVKFENWLSTTREQEIEDTVTTKKITALPQDKKPTPLNVKRLYSSLLNAAHGKPYDSSVTDEIVPDLKLFFAPLLEKNTEILELKSRLSKVENEVVDLRDKMLQPDDDLYEPALEDGTINKARLEGEKLYLEQWRAWAEERRNRQDFTQYPLFSLGAPLADEVAEIARNIPANPIIILDVLSPPITSVGTKMDGRNIHVIPISPYADEFNFALQKAGIKPPVPVIKILPENLVKTFGAKSIDIVHCREALEYTKNPVVVLTEMLSVMKDSGAIFLSHQVNKASEENFNSLAQWNCVEKGGQFIIWNSWYKFNITRMFAGVYEVQAKSYIDFVEVIIKRKPA